MKRFNRRKGFANIVAMVAVMIVLAAGYSWWMQKSIFDVQTAASAPTRPSGGEQMAPKKINEASSTSVLPATINPIACTQETKQCPDGSYVGRTGPNCAFAACPAASGNGILRGKVTVGPICPVERVGFPCLVPPTAYTSREVIVYAVNGTTVIARKNFNPDGTYSFSLPPGSYVVNTPNSGVGGARDLPETVIIKSGETTTLDFSIDTGIR